MTEAEKEMKRRDQARVLRDMHRSKTVFKDKTSVPPRRVLDVTSLPR